MGAAGAAAQPRAVAVEPVVDVGQVMRGEEIEHVFELRNDGDAPLDISQVKPACGCAVAEFDALIAAGESGRIRTVTRTLNLRGPIAKSVAVFTSDPNNPQINLVVKADVRAPLVATPSYARFVAVKGEPVPSRSQTVWTQESSDLQVSKVDSPFAFLRVNFREAAEEERQADGRGRQWRIELMLDVEAAPLGPMADYVEVHTTLPQQSVLKIPVSGLVQPRVGVIPAQADFGERELTEPYQTSIEVRNHSSKPIEVTQVEVDLEGVEAELKLLTEGRRYEVRVTLLPVMAKGKFHGLLKLHTNSPAEPVIEVPLTGNVL